MKLTSLFETAKTNIVVAKISFPWDSRNHLYDGSGHSRLLISILLPLLQYRHFIFCASLDG